MKEIKQKDFYNGAIENINPEMSVTDQAYLLPFDSRWEFPKERLKLGKQNSKKYRVEKINVTVLCVLCYALKLQLT